MEGVGFLNIIRNEQLGQEYFISNHYLQQSKKNQVQVHIHFD